MKKANNIEKYKAKIIELADKLLEKEKECSYLNALKSVHEMRIEALEKQLNDDKRYKDLIEHIEQQDNKITSLIKQRDNYKNDYEYAEECFQAERNRRWELEEQLNKIKDIVKDDKNEFYEKCPLKVFHVDTEDDIILDKTENKTLLNDFEISDSICDCYQAFFLIDKKRARSVPFAMICGPLISKSDFKMYDNFLEEDIMFIERVINDTYPFDIKRYHIDLRYGKVYDSEYALRLARKENKNG